MNPPTEAQRSAAQHLLARDAQHLGSAEERAAAARRVYEGVTAQLGTLVGMNAARALFARSVKVTARRFPLLQPAVLRVEQGEALGEHLFASLRGAEPEAVTETAVALFATLLALLGSLIGDRLTAKVLRDSYPPPGPPPGPNPPEEEKK